MITGKVEYRHTERGHQLSWWRADSQEEGGACLSEDCWEAIQVAIARMKDGPTPGERAQGLVEKMHAHGIIRDFSGFAPSTARQWITEAIEAAIEADRTPGGTTAHVEAGNGHR